MLSADRGKLNVPDGEHTSTAEPALREYDTRTLFNGDREIVINHAGSAYRMKITKQGKLILNK
jgi:hemin uptake protein HemP